MTFIPTKSADRRVIRDDEKTHLTVLQSVAESMGGTTSDLDSCQFNFDAALGDVTTFMATARVLEVVGVNACVSCDSIEQGEGG